MIKTIIKGVIIGAVLGFLIKITESNISDAISFALMVGGPSGAFIGFVIKGL